MGHAIAGAVAVRRVGRPLGLQVIHSIGRPRPAVDVVPPGRRQLDPSVDHVDVADQLAAATQRTTDERQEGRRETPCAVAHGLHASGGEGPRPHRPAHVSSAPLAAPTTAPDVFSRP